ncbi:hypothetical protein HDV62DRAFT_392504 [Trichoderma sp. SZMC 28011]
MGRGRRICGGPQQVNTLLINQAVPLAQLDFTGWRAFPPPTRFTAWQKRHGRPRDWHDISVLRHVVDNSAGVGITMSLCAGGLVDVDAVG